MARGTGSDRGEKAIYKQASDDGTMARSQMKFLQTQYKFINIWLDLRAILPLLKRDLSKASQVLRFGEP